MPGSIDPMYYDASYFVAPDGKAGIDVVCRPQRGRREDRENALARVVISREGTDGRPPPHGRRSDGAHAS